MAGEQALLRRSGLETLKSTMVFQALSLEYLLTSRLGLKTNKKIKISFGLSLTIMSPLQNV